MAIDEEKPLHIVMFPWLAFGHMIPNLELAKLIAQKGHKVSFVSTPRNIQRLPKLSPLINFIELQLPKQPNLPENAEATSDVPYDVVPHLKQAYDGLQQPLTHFLESSMVDWIFYDFIPYWVAPIASKLGTKCAFYSIFTPSFMGFIGPASPIVLNEPLRTKPEEFTVPPPWVPIPSTVAFRYFEIMKISDVHSDNDSGVSDMYRWGASFENSDVVVIRGCTDFEPQWFPVLDNIIQKPIFPVGQLPSTTFEASEVNKNDTWRWMKEWLDKKERSMVVYVAFGSEAKPSQEEVNEIALGLEKSKLPFFWALKDRCGPTDTIVLRLPEGFEERTKERGVVCTKWVPQMKILGHVAVGGFLTHAGWTSVVEAVTPRAHQ